MHVRKSRLQALRKIQQHGTAAGQSAQLAAGENVLDWAQRKVVFFWIKLPTKT
jgi:hypothetical protein